MKKQIWLAAGIAGMLLGNPAADAKAALSVQISTGSHPSFIINSAPNFIYLRTQGFSVSVGSPYDIVYYSNYYYLYHGNHWYRSSSYHGPWIIILNKRLPYQIRRHRWEDIRRYRDIEYRRPDRSHNQYQRTDDNRRRLLDQRYEVNHRRVHEQQHKVVEPRRVHEQQHKVVEPRRVHEQQHKVIEPRRVHEQQHKVVEPRRVHEQQHKGGNSDDGQNNRGKRE